MLMDSRKLRLPLEGDVTSRAIDFKTISFTRFFRVSLTLNIEAEFVSISGVIILIGKSTTVDDGITTDAVNGISN